MSDTSYRRLYLHLSLEELKAFLEVFAAFLVILFFVLDYYRSLAMLPVSCFFWNLRVRFSSSELPCPLAHDIASTL